ncbi:SURF1 family protein [Vibrio alfacsensis]|uniref:SURF1 family protein n=1 Tax=Vibrio alfacsensis TaxID=1074311 RepID=UPI004068C5F4
MAPPVLSLWLSKGGWLAVCLTVAVFSLLVKLGFWQFERGNEKRLLEQAIIARADAPYREISTLLDTNDWREESVLGIKVKAAVNPAPFPLILLDNQTFEGKVGYLAFQIVSLSQEPEVLTLIELGFVQGARTRTELPNVKVLAVPLNVTGRLYRKSANPLSSALMAEVGSTMRVQNLNIDQLSQLLNTELMPTILQPDNLENWPYSFPWNPIPLTSAKHFGYSFQWFAMAGVFLLITVWIFVRWIRKGMPQGEKA